MQLKRMESMNGNCSSVWPDMARGEPGPAGLGVVSWAGDFAAASCGGDKRNARHRRPRERAGLSMLTLGRNDCSRETALTSSISPPSCHVPGSKRRASVAAVSSNSLNVVVDGAGPSSPHRHHTGRGPFPTSTISGSEYKLRLPPLA